MPPQRPRKQKPQPKDSLKYQSVHEVSIPASEEYITVPKRDWRRLKNYIEKLPSGAEPWETASSFLGGLAVSSITTWLQLSNESSVKEILLIVFFATTLGSVISFIASRSSRKNFESSKVTVNAQVEEIDQLQQ